MSTLILTAAGRSTRFPNHRPKWSLTHPSGHMMAAESIRHIRGISRLLVVMRRDHVEEFGMGNIEREFSLAGLKVKRFEIIVIEPTESQVETISAALEVGAVEGPFTIKDCDNQFRLDLPLVNSVALVDLHSMKNITPGNKSYAQIEFPPGRTKISSVREKKIVSPYFCCGAYSFTDPGVWRDARKAAPECKFVSQVIDTSIGLGKRFSPVFVEGESYLDWGTEADWARFRESFSTLFVDVDGVLCRSSHRSFSPRWGESDPIFRNVEALNRLHQSGRVHIVLTTARPESARSVTEEQLAGLSYDRLIMGLPSARRVLINDVVRKRGETTARAINLERDSEELENVLKMQG